MASLSRTTSTESAASIPNSHNGSWIGDAQEHNANISTNMSSPPSPTHASRPPNSLASTGRVPSHSLLSAAQGFNGPSRKGRFADAGTVGGNVGRASISMPPPATKPSSIYRPSSVRRPPGSQNTLDSKDSQISLDGMVEDKVYGDAAGLDDTRRSASPHINPVSEPHSPSVLSDSCLKPPSSSLNKPGDRSSFSSLYSIGSAIYNGAAGVTSAPQSAASSNAGSVKSVEQSTPTPTPISPSLGSNKGEAASIATTATDPVSVTANSPPSHQGSTFTRRFDYCKVFRVDARKQSPYLS